MPATIASLRLIVTFIHNLHRRLFGDRSQQAILLGF
jgi:hypothetical protein